MNGLLGYRESNRNAALVGEIETTLEPKNYRHPILKALYLWDLPGIGTPRHPIQNYFENYCLGAFDAILIVFDDRLMASDIDIARRARYYDIPVFFIKNKSDLVNIYFMINFYICQLISKKKNSVDRKKDGKDE